MSINRDVVIAICLLIICGVLMMASFDIREPDYGQLSPASWPRTLVVILSVLSLIYLIQSLRRSPADDPQSAQAESSPPFTQPVKFFRYWQNVVWCFTLFALYLLTMPWLGMLVGASLFVFLLLNFLGGWTPRLLLLHATIALVVIGGMWSLFTYGLGVLLPSGELFSRF